MQHVIVNNGKDVIVGSNMKDVNNKITTINYMMGTNELPSSISSNYFEEIPQNNVI